MKGQSEHSRERIWQMFDDISPTYDLTNRVMTFRRDRYWRKAVAKLMPTKPGLHVLDVATGTGDQLFALMESSREVAEATGVDLSQKMLEIAQAKLKEKPYAQCVSWQCASALSLPFAAQQFDCVTIAFGIRNVTDVQAALREFKRVLKPGGRLLVLEATVPQNRLIRFGYFAYMRHVMPRVGKWIAKNENAYRYLNETIESFPAGAKFCALVRDAGFANATAKTLTFGLVTVYMGEV